MEWVDRYTFLCTLQVKHAAIAPLSTMEGRGTFVACFYICALWSLFIGEFFPKLLEGINSLYAAKIVSTLQPQISSNMWNKHSIWQAIWQALLKKMLNEWHAGWPHHQFLTEITHDIHSVQGAIYNIYAGDLYFGVF